MKSPSMKRLINRFDYDEVFGTVLNRFCVQAADGPSADRLRQGRADARLPGYSRYGALRRTRLSESGRHGRMPRVTTSSPNSSRCWISRTWCRTPGKNLGLKVEIDHLPDPRVEAEAALLQREALQADRPRTAAAPALRFAARFADEHRHQVSRPHRSVTLPAAGQLAEPRNDRRIQTNIAAGVSAGASHTGAAAVKETKN